MSSLVGKGGTFEADVLKLIFQAVTIANVAENASSSPITSVYVALHTADPTSAGDQTSNEATYTGYARVAVVRTSSGWSVSGAGPATVTNVSAVTFPTCTGGSNTITWFSIGVASSGASKILYGGQLQSSFPVSNGVTPSFAAGTLGSNEQ